MKTTDVVKTKGWHDSYAENVDWIMALRRGAARRR
jgi:hypothetical protein